MAWTGWSRPSISGGGGGVSIDSSHIIAFTTNQIVTSEDLPELTGSLSTDTWNQDSNVTFTDTPTLTLI